MLTVVSVQPPALAPDLLLDTYFARIHGKPYFILDEATTRQRLQANQLPSHLAFAIYAVSARYETCIYNNGSGLIVPDMHLTLVATMPLFEQAQNTHGEHG